MLGHDTGNTFRNVAAEGPSADPTVQWTANAATIAFSVSYIHPLIVDGVVYVTVQQETTQDSPNEHHEHFLAIDGETGEARTVFSVEGYITAPTVVDGTAYVGVANTSDDTTTVRAYDLETGTERWRQSHRFLVGPTGIRVVDGIVIATLSSVVWGKNDEGEYVVPSPQEYAFDAETGELLWTGTGSETRTLEPRPPIVTDGMTLYPDTTTVRRLETGDVQAKLSTGLDFPVLADGELYGLVGNRDPDEDGVLVSYDWSSLDHRWTYDPDGDVRPGWAVAVDDVVVVNDRENVISGVHRESGERLWRTTDLWDEYLETMFRVATRETVYVVHFGGAVTALDPTDGTIKWQLKTDRMDWDTVTGCALADDLLVTVGYDGTVFAIS